MVVIASGFGLRLEGTRGDAHPEASKASKAAPPVVLLFGLFFLAFQLSVVGPGDDPRDRADLVGRCHVDQLHTLGDTSRGADIANLDSDSLTLYCHNEEPVIRLDDFGADDLARLIRAIHCQDA